MADLSTSNAPERWSIQRPVNRSGVVSEWEDILASTHVPFDVRLTQRTPDRFRGTVVRKNFGELAVVDCLCPPFSGHHGAMTGAVEESSIGFQTVHRGVERVRCKSAADTVTPGQAVLWDGAQPVDVEVVEPLMKRTLIFPRERVLAVCPRLADPRALRSLSESPGARLLARYLDALADEMPDFAPGQDTTVKAATDVALELLRAAVEPEMRGDRAAARDALRADVRRYIRTRLMDPGLTPESIARAHAISLRSLHGLFEGTGESVAALVRRSRLERCRADLEQPDGGSVTDIAFRWGFIDAAHFSNVFKREFGLTPRDVRRAAVSYAQIGK